MEQTIKNSQKQADILAKILPLLLELDPQYLKSCHKDMFDMLQMRAAASVLIPGYDPKREEINRKELNVLLQVANAAENYKSLITLKVKNREAEQDLLKASDFLKAY